MRIIAPTFDWSADEDESPRDKLQNQKMESKLLQGDKKKNYPNQIKYQKIVPDSKTEISQENKKQINDISPTTTKSVLLDEDKSGQTLKTNRFEESNELLKSIYEFNKSSRQQ